VLDDRNRVVAERENIARLKEKNGWLTAVVWSFYEGKLSCECVIDAHGHEYAIRMIYPNLFPILPPEVRPLEQDQRWSIHQYLNGTLCLEWGPDNWEPQITGADMLISTHRLLENENPLGDPVTQPIPVPSRHFLTLGQELRGEYWRFLVTKSWMEHARTISMNQHATVDLIVQILQVSSSFVCIPTSIKINDSEWIDPTLPPIFRMQSNLKNGVLLRASVSIEDLNKINSIEEIIDIFHEAGLDGWPGCDGFSIKPGFYFIFILDDQDHLGHFIVYKKDEALSFYKAHILQDDRNIPRLPMESVHLEEKSIAIIGAGSMGSKIAVSLVRSGIRKVLLIDPDVLLPGNITRHALDWKSVGFHKVEALREELISLAPGIEVEVENIRIAGQESNTVIARVMEKVVKYDILVDATAGSDVFNFLAAISVRTEKPMVWGEVYGGGLGGFVARSRPIIGSNPRDVRNAYLYYCEKNEVPEYLLNTNDYSTSGELPMVASDADVSVIAHYIVQLVLDLLLNGQNSIFPEDLYLIGLKKGWVFDFPFQNHSIHVETQQSPNIMAECEGTSPEDKTTEWENFMRDLLSGDGNASSDSK
jgi:sulfur-carrier protein adenylyltransferase/sulfurtransferase